MSGELLESGFGMELIETEAIKILYNELNDEIQRINDLWQDRDLEINQLIGADPIQTELELIQEGNFHTGNMPSLIEADIDGYPNVCAICDASNPSDEGFSFDQVNNYANSLAIEIMCKSVYNESEANRRTQRTLEAVHNVLMRNSTLNGIIEGFDSDPSALLTNVFTRKDNPQGEADWYWRAGRIDYQITRHAQLPE